MISQALFDLLMIVVVLESIGCLCIGFLIGYSLAKSGEEERFKKRNLWIDKKG